VDDYPNAVVVNMGTLMNHSGSNQFIGAENLDLMENAVRYTAHVGQLVASELPTTGNILEFGAGSGSQTAHVLKPTERLTCIEINPALQETLIRRGYKVASVLKEIADNSQSCAYSINCLEHIEDDEGVLKILIDKVLVGGKIIIYVPAMPILFSSMDRLVGHHRRYKRNGLIELVKSQGMSVVECRYVDSLGVIPSLLYRLIPKSSGEPSVRSLKIYDMLLFPLSKFCDHIFGKFFGKNLFVVAVKS
jgi:hypothetical protein